MFGIKFVSQKAFNQLLETVTLYSRTLEDIGWINVSLQQGDQAQLIGEGFKKMLRTCRLYYVKNPLAGHWVHLTTDFVFGEGVSKPKAKKESPKTQEVIDKFWSDPDNKKALTSYQAQRLLSNKLQYEGNLFFVLFDDEEGDVRIRILNTEEIADVIRDPDDRMRPVFYKAAKHEQKYSFFSDAYEISMTKYLYYQDIDNHNPDDYNIPDEKRLKGAVVYHIKINCDINDKFGIPELYRGIDWIKAHKDMAADLATLIKSLSTLAWRKKVKGTPTQVTSLRNAAQAKTDLTNPAKIAGSTQYENEAIDTTAISTPTGGAVIGEKGLKQMTLMVCAAAGIFYHYFGDPETGNLATTTSMELPMIKKFVAYQKLWEAIYSDILEYVIHKKIEVGVFPGTATYDEKTVRMVYEPEEDIAMDIDFPPIIEKDPKVVADALKIAKDANLIGDETAAKIFLLACGQNNIDDEIEKIDFTRQPPIVSPWGQAFAGGRPVQEPAAAAGVPAKPAAKPAEIPIKEAVAGQKDPAFKLTKKNNYLLQRMNGYKKALAGHYATFQKDIRESSKTAGMPGKIVGIVENLEDHLDKFKRGMISAAESYFPVAIDIGKKYLQSHLKEVQIRDSLFEANNVGRDLLAAKLAWNEKFISDSLIPDMQVGIEGAMRMPYDTAEEFMAAINGAVNSFESRVEQYAGAFWTVEEAAVKEAGKGTGAYINFVGADDNATCQGCADAMDGNPYLIDEAPEPGSYECDGRCRHALQIQEEAS